MRPLINVQLLLPCQKLPPEASLLQEMGSSESTAQVHPKLLTETLLRAAERDAGSTVRIGTVSDVRLADDNSVRGECLQHVTGHGVAARAL